MSKPIIKLRSTARVGEVADTAERLLKRYKTVTEVSEDKFLKGIYVKLENLYNALSEAIKSGIAHSQLDDADTLRDSKIRMLEKVLNGYQNLPIEDLKKHGQKLYGVFAKYGLGIIKENYVNQSGLIEALLKDLSATDLQASIEALSGVSQSIEELREAQEAFNQQRLDYEKAQAKQGSQEKATSLKKSVVELINNELVQYVRTMKMVNPTQYQTFADEVAEAINTTNEVVKRRQKDTPPNTEIL
ncbi:DUF6261 family protein [Bergeyella porcorum]|uniref:DUF6261 family protein n=1 Tax=Bergeyella porcorum TaxID=1735111 RepID=UPI0035EF7CA4